MKHFARFSLLPVFAASAMLAFGQNSGSPAPNGALPENDPGNQGVVTRAVQWGKGTNMSRLEKKVPANAFRSEIVSDQGAVRVEQYSATYGPGFPNELIRVQNPGDAGFRK